MPRYATARWVFFRLLGLTYLFAFWSLWTQVLGLIGQGGVLPAHEYLAAARAWAESAHVGVERFRLLPTVFWLGAGNTALTAVCGTGVLLSLLLIAGIVPLATVPALWAAYLSLSVVCRDFLAFQWDALLLEAGLLAVCVAPAVWIDRFSTRPEPPRAGVWLFQWLLFRLMFGSGVVKLASGDPTWRGLTALAYHYETQPIPTPLAWYARQLPLRFQEGSAVVTFVIELAVPWVMVVPRRIPRLVVAVSFVSLQVLIAITGNYAFFNLLTASLCVFLIRDDWWNAALSRATQGQSTRVEQLSHGTSFVRPIPGRIHTIIATAAAVVILPVSTVIFAGSFGIGLPGRALVEPVADLLAPLRSINSYGLFAVMTRTRPEIVIEASMDGATWEPYEFRYKAGDVHRRPPWIAPFQPRLDWQMWFAALGQPEDNLWFTSLCARLLEASPDVLRLLARAPFGDRRPNYVRATLYQYKFADRASHAATGDWWTRAAIGEYLPAVSARVH